MDEERRKFLVTVFKCKKSLDDIEVDLKTFEDLITGDDEKLKETAKVRLMTGDLTVHSPYIHS